MKIKQMKSNRGNAIANQFVVDAFNEKYFQSYDSIIVKIINNKVFLDEYYWDYSMTTSKYRNQFLNETTKETQEKINSGEYKLTNLNK